MTDGIVEAAITRAREKLTEEAPNAAEEATPKPAEEPRAEELIAAEEPKPAEAPQPTKTETPKQAEGLGY